MVEESVSANRKSTKHWSQLGERGVYLGLRTMLLFYRVFGRVGFSLLLYPVITYFFLTGRSARHASNMFLTRVYERQSSPDVLTVRPGWKQSFHHFMCFGDAILDKVLAWIGAINIGHLDLDHAREFEEMCEKGQGGVLIASHLGNIAVSHALGDRMLGRRINVIVHTKHAETFNRLMREVSPKSNLALFQVADVGPDTAIVLRERIARGEFLAIVGDRTPHKQKGRVNWMPFLGHDAPFPQGPFQLAAMLKCPVLMLFCFKIGSKYNVICKMLGDTSQISRKDRAQALDGLSRHYVTTLEQYCLQYPYQWFNFFDFWAQADPSTRRR